MPGIFKNFQHLEFDGDSPIQGQRFKQIDILNLSSNNTYITKINQDISKADAKTDALENSLLQMLGDLTEAKDEDINTAKEDIKTEVKTDISDAVTTVKKEVETDISNAINKEEVSWEKLKTYLPLAKTPKNSSRKKMVNGILGMLVEHGMALDDEVDLRAVVTDKRFETLEALYPLEVSYDAPNGLICNNANGKFSDITIYLHNRSNEDVSFQQFSVI